MSCVPMVKKLIEQLDTVMIGQYSSKQALLALIVNRINGLSFAKNALLCGCVGSGKTMLIEQIATLFPLPLFIFSALNYVDIQVLHIIKQHPLVIILIEDIHTLSIDDQMLLANLLDGKMHLKERGIIDTHNIIFICSGVCNSVDIFIPQLQSQFTIQTTLSSLTELDLLYILQKDFVLPYQQALLKQNITCTLTNCALASLAYVAYKQNQLSQNIGVRRLHFLLQKLTQQLMFEFKSNYTVDSNYIMQFDVVLDYTQYLL